MKRVKILGVALAMLGATSFASAQEIRKEVNVEVENGERVMTIKTTDEDGNVTIEDYKGEEAKKKMDEMHKNVPKGAVIEKHIIKDITDEEGNHVIIKKTCDGEPHRKMMWKGDSDMSKEEMEAFHEKMKAFHETLSDDEKKMMHHKMKMGHGNPEMHKKMMEMHKDMSPEEREKFHNEMKEMHKEMKVMHEEMDIQVDEKDGKVIININGEEQVIDISDVEGMKDGEHKMIFITEEEGEDGMKMKKEIIIITRNVRIEEDKSLKNNLKGIDFKTYPNPNNGDFNIELNLDGKK